MFTILIFVLLTLVTADSSAESDQAWLRAKEAKHQVVQFETSIIHVIRLVPEEDLLESLWRYARVKNITAASIVSTVGSLQTANIRFADQDEGTFLVDRFEIVSLVGNIDFQDSESASYSGSGHVHISCSNSAGKTIGGHLLTGSLIYTTAEITLVEIVDGLFQREPDVGPNGSGYYELKVYEL